MPSRAGAHRALLRRLDGALAGIDMTLDASIIDGCMPVPLHDTPESEECWAAMSTAMRAGGNGRLSRKCYEVWVASFEPRSQEDRRASGDEVLGWHGPHHVLDLDPDFDADDRIDIFCPVHFMIPPDGNLDAAIDAAGRRNRSLFRHRDVHHATVLACVAAGMLHGNDHHGWHEVNDIARAVSEADHSCRTLQSSSP